MATSRTGTATWKRVREQAIRRAKRNGVTHCRHCNALLDYEQGLTPTSAEPDHLIPSALGVLVEVVAAEVELTIAAERWRPYDDGEHVGASAATVAPVRMSKQRLFGDNFYAHVRPLVKKEVALVAESHLPPINRIPHKT